MTTKIEPSEEHRTQTTRPTLHENLEDLVDEDDDDLVEVEEPYADDGESPILARTVYDAIRRSSR